MQKTYALFDFDGTLIRGNSIILLCLYAYRKGYISKHDAAQTLWTAFLYGLHLCPAVRAKERSLSFLVGKTAAQVDVIAEDFCQTVLAPRLRPQGLEAIRTHRAAGHEVLLISASSAFYLHRMQARLGVNDMIATHLDVDETGLFAGRVCGENCRGLQKPLRLAEYLAAKGDRLDYDTSFAYGDSYSDLPMLRLCAHKVAVNPKARLWRALRKLEGATRVRWREP
ncbi:MAG: HAD-IB family hydrolase [Eubacteriales bacterium]|nr:HAD-IB family hydrolase [Eubacteriales bacterium]